MGLRSGLRAACGTKGAVPRVPNHAFGFQNGAKMVKHRGPEAFQEQTGSGEVQEDPKNPKTPTFFWEPFRVQNETQKQGVLSEVFWSAFGLK